MPTPCARPAPFTRRRFDWGPKLEEAFRAVLDDLRSRYVLTYYPSGVPETGWHRIEVRLSRGGKVTARAGYFRGRDRR